ncbi:MAG: hypothetical protein ABH871_08170 [Pseudomonadota bacterium]
MVGALAVMIGLGLLAYGCSDDSKNGPNDTNDAGTGGTGGSAGTSGTGGSGGADAGAGGVGGAGGGNPWDREGFNGKFHTCFYNSDGDCPVVDLDLDGNQMHLMTGYPINRKGKINLDQTEPMTSVDANFGFGTQNFIGHDVEGYGLVHPPQLVKLSNGNFLVPFSEDMAWKSGIALIDQTGYVPRWVLDPKFGVDPIGILAGLDKDGRIYLSVTDRTTEDGKIMSYGIKPNGDLNEADASTPISTSGKKPSTIADLGNGRMAVLNTKGLFGASIDIIDTVQGVVINNTSLGPNVEAVPLYELSLTADKKYAIVAGGEQGERTTIYIVNLETATLESSLDLKDMSYCEEIRGIDIDENMNAYISTVGGTDGDEVLIIDFTTPEKVKRKGAVFVGYDLGAIAVHESGIVYVVATDRYWEAEGTAETNGMKRWSHIVAFDPLQVTN